MSPPRFETRGPILLLTRDRAIADRVRALLDAERFEVLVTRSAKDALDVAARAAPTVILLDFALDDDPAPEELAYRLRPRRAGPRVIAIASAREAPPAEVSALRASVDRCLDAEELVDLVWRFHHEVLDARGKRS